MASDVSSLLVLPVALRLGIQQAGGDPALAQIKAMFGGGEQGVIYDLKNAATVFQERTGALATTPSGADGPIGTLKDLSPNNNYCIAPSAAGSPAWRAAGYAETDGINDYLKVAFTLNQTVTRVTCVRLIAGTANKRVIDGGVEDAGLLFCSSANVLSIFSGAGVIGAIAAADGEDLVITERFSSTTSRIAKNSGSYTTGNAGVSQPGGITLGASAAGTNLGNARYYRTVAIARSLTDPEIAVCRTWCGAAAGLVL